MGSEHEPHRYRDGSIEEGPSSDDDSRPPLDGSEIRFTPFSASASCVAVMTSDDKQQVRRVSEIALGNLCDTPRSCHQNVSS